MVFSPKVPIKELELSAGGGMMGLNKSLLGIVSFSIMIILQKILFRNLFMIKIAR